LVIKTENVTSVDCFNQQAIYYTDVPFISERLCIWCRVQISVV